MTEFSWRPFGEAEDVMAGSPFRPDPDVANQLLERDIAAKFPAGWLQRTEETQSEGVENG